MTSPTPIRVTLREVTRSAMEDMAWLSPSDAALRALAMKLAETIDACGADPELLAVLVPKYHAVLKDLGGTPTTRRELNTAEPEEDIVAELRSA